MQKYYNPRLHNAVVAGTGMEHPRRPHVVLGSELNGYVQGDLVDANGICDLIHEKNVDTYAKLEALETSLKNETKARTQDKDNIVASLNTLIADKLGSTETVQGESAERQAGDAALQLQIDEQNTNYTTVQTAVNNLTTSVNNKQDALVGGTNIKNLDDGTGNTISLLGSGNVSFKTINGHSIIGSDDIEVSNAVCDCPYQVIIKSTKETNNAPVFELVKGDYATTRNKIENGEYVDFVLYDNGHLSNGVTDEDGDEGYVQQTGLVDILACSSFIKIKAGSNPLNLYWTADGVSMTRPGNSGDDSGDDGPLK